MQKKGPKKILEFSFFNSYTRVPDNSSQKKKFNPSRFQSPKNDVNSGCLSLSLIGCCNYFFIKEGRVENRTKKICRNMLPIFRTCSYLFFLFMKQNAFNLQTNLQHGTCPYGMSFCRFFGAVQRFISSVRTDPYFSHFDACHIYILWIHAIIFLIFGSCPYIFNFWIMPLYF